ncbi:unnamed protein product, partial [Symbiodinium sp. KB8]
EFDWLEFFAGHANGTRAVRLRGFKGARFDLKYFEDNGGHSNYQVSRVGWYMGAYFANSLKRQFAYANSPAIRRLDRGQLQVTRARLQRTNHKIKTRRVYTNKAGKTCYQGTKQLKDTEKYPVLFGLAVAKILEELKADLYEFAKLGAAYEYIRGGKSLRIPQVSEEALAATPNRSEAEILQELKELQAELAVLEKKPIRLASTSTLSLDSQEVDQPVAPPPAVPATEATVPPPEQSASMPAQIEPSLRSKSEEEADQEEHEEEEASGEEMLKNAAKQRIRRMVKPKTKRSDLEVPKWVAEQWNKGTSQKEAMAALLQEVNWDKDEGWYSASEMKSDLKWSTSQRINAAVAHCERKPSIFIRRNLYDGVLEYWVTVRETGRHVESLKEAEKPVELPDDAFAGFDNMTKRLLPEAEGPGSADDKRHVKALDDGITKLELEHDKLNLHFAQAEISGFNQENAKKYMDKDGSADQPAPVASAIRAARAVLEEVPEAMGSSIRIMAGCGEKNSERDAHRVARRCRVTLPIMITEVMIHGWQVPLILLSAWLTFLLGRNLLHTLSGLPHPDLARSHATWKCFWSRYQKLYPNHDVFRRAAKGELDLSRTVGLVLHGDEGRTKKKSAILVLSCHSILGYGSHATDPQPEPYCKQYLNMTGHTLSTRWVLGCLPKTYYDGEDGDNFFQEYLNVFVEDMLRVYEKGIKAATGEVYHFVILNVIGDWPWFVKAFSLIRNFANCSKQETSRAPSKGICHVCKADMMNYPFEDFTSASPAWRATINEERYLSWVAF